MYAENISPKYPILYVERQNTKGDIIMTMKKPVLDTEDIIIDILVLIGDILKG
ncbi:MAG: hypothetical protein IJP86_05875 [Synergistaceae bacterium]|nr:hypothetical protein [Synergistaceae bacterium]